jgi:hypothetical protein
MDTHETVKRLIASGASEKLAEEVTKVVKESHDYDFSGLATKEDIKRLESDISGLKWMIGMQVPAILMIVGLLKIFM